MIDHSTRRIRRISPLGYRDVDTHEETNVSGIPLGAQVLIPRSAGVRVPWEDSIRIVDTKDILAIVEEAVIL